MAIEFRCTHCNKLLRTGDETAARQAKCPDCGAVMTVPAAAAAAAAVPPPLAPGDNPFVASPQPSGPAGISTPILDLGDIFGRTWTIFKERWSECVVAWLVVVALSAVIAYGCGFVAGMAGRIVLGPRIGTMFFHLGHVAGQLIAIWLGIGLAIYMLKVAAASRLNWATCSRAGRATWRFCSRRCCSPSSSVWECCSASCRA